MFLAPFHTVNCTTFENARIQLPSSGSIGMTASTQTRDNERVWRAGELAGSGKVSFHTLTSLELSNSTLSKRCFRVRETHDLETRQHRFSAFVSSRRRSMMRSEISGGRRGLDSMMVAVLIKSLEGCLIVDSSNLAFPVLTKMPTTHPTCQCFVRMCMPGLQLHAPPEHIKRCSRNSHCRQLGHTRVAINRAFFADTS